MLWNEPTETHARTFAVRRVSAINFPTDSPDTTTNWFARNGMNGSSKEISKRLSRIRRKMIKRRNWKPFLDQKFLCVRGTVCTHLSIFFFFKEMTLLDNRPGSSVYPITRKITRRPWNSVMMSRAIIIRASEFSSSPLLLPLFFFSFPLFSLFNADKVFSRFEKWRDIKRGEKVVVRNRERRNVAQHRLWGTFVTVKRHKAAVCRGSRTYGAK